MQIRRRKILKKKNYDKYTLLSLPRVINDVILLKQKHKSENSAINNSRAPKNCSNNRSPMERWVRVHGPNHKLQLTLHLPCHIGALTDLQK